MQKVIEILELEKSMLSDLIKHKVADEADSQIIAEIDQALQLLQSRVSIQVCTIGGDCKSRGKNNHCISTVYCGYKKHT